MSPNVTTNGLPLIDISFNERETLKSGTHCHQTRTNCFLNIKGDTITIVIILNIFNMISSV